MKILYLYVALGLVYLVLDLIRDSNGWKNHFKFLITEYKGEWNPLLFTLFVFIYVLAFFAYPYFLYVQISERYIHTTAAHFERFTIRMTNSQALKASRTGFWEDAVTRLLEEPKIKRQLKNIKDSDLAAELFEYGAWDKEELYDSREANEKRIVWIAACNIRKELYKGTEK
jgi:hypothetical protein